MLSQKMMPVVSKRGLVHGFCRAAESCVAVSLLQAEQMKPVGVLVVEAVLSFLWALLSAALSPLSLSACFTPHFTFCLERAWSPASSARSFMAVRHGQPTCTRNVDLTSSTCMCCLRRILDIKWQDHIPNNDILTRTV